MSPDAIFDDPRLAAVYDPLDPDRNDLDAYAELVTEFDAQTVLDVGCGTGTLACLLARRGIDVVAVDPAGASLEVARAKPGADRVRWWHGDATTLPELAVDLATMTANVAQVFLTDNDWIATLRGIRAALRPGGVLVFETRVPEQEAWRRWNRTDSLTSVEIPGVGVVESWRSWSRSPGRWSPSTTRRRSSRPARCWSRRPPCASVAATRCSPPSRPPDSWSRKCATLWTVPGGNWCSSRGGSADGHVYPQSVEISS